MVDDATRPGLGSPFSQQRDIVGSTAHHLASAPMQQFCVDAQRYVVESWGSADRVRKLSRQLQRIGRGHVSAAERAHWELHAAHLDLIAARLVGDLTRIREAATRVVACGAPSTGPRQERDLVLSETLVTLRSWDPCSTDLVDAEIRCFDRLTRSGGITRESRVEAGTMLVEALMRPALASAEVENRFTHDLERAKTTVDYCRHALEPSGTALAELQFVEARLLALGAWTRGEDFDEASVALCRRARQLLEEDEPTVGNYARAQEMWEWERSLGLGLTRARALPVVFYGDPVTLARHPCVSPSALARIWATASGGESEGDFRDHKRLVRALVANGDRGCIDDLGLARVVMALSNSWLEQEDTTVPGRFRLESDPVMDLVGSVYLTWPVTGDHLSSPLQVALGVHLHNTGNLEGQHSRYRTSMRMLHDGFRRARPGSRLQAVAAFGLVQAIDATIRSLDATYDGGEIDDIIAAITAAVPPGHDLRADILQGVLQVLSRFFRYADSVPYAEEHVAMLQADFDAGLVAVEEVREARTGLANLLLDRYRFGPGDGDLTDLERADRLATELVESEPRISRLWATLAVVRTEQARLRGTPLTSAGWVQREALRTLPEPGHEDRENAIHSILDQLDWDLALGDADHQRCLGDVLHEAISLRELTVRRVVNAANLLICDSPPDVRARLAVSAALRLLPRTEEFARLDDPRNALMRSQGLFAEAALVAAGDGDLDVATMLVEAGTGLIARFGGVQRLGAVRDGPLASAVAARSYPRTCAELHRMSDRLGAPVVHVAAARGGGFALVHNESESCVVQLPEMTTAAVARWRENLAGEDHGRVVSALRGPRGASPPERRRLLNVLDELAHAAAPMYEAFPSREPERGAIHLVALGSVAVLPWLAASVHGRRPPTVVHPSAALLRSAMGRTPRERRRGVALTSPVPCAWGGKNYGDLPFARIEGRYLEDHLGAVVLRDQDATRLRLLEAWREPVAFIHLATHGDLGAGEMQESTLLFAPETSTQFSSSLAPESSVLTAVEASGLRIDTGLVFLAACSTGSIVTQLPDESIGFTSALHLAGARQVIAPLWPVDDEEACALVIAFYSAWRQGSSVPDALVAAGRETRRRFPAGVSWAAFNVSGPA